MSITVTCESCQHVIRAKDEHAGKRVRCPECQTIATLPSLEGDSSDDLDSLDEVESPPPARGAPRKGGSQAAGTRQKRPAAKSGPLARYWHWMVIGLVLLLALIPSNGGLVMATVALLAGALVTLMAGIFPFLRVIFGDPGTVFTMMVSRSARFDMMRQPDSHPYKKLVRTAFDPTRGLFWKGVLLMVAFFPAMYVNLFSKEFLRTRPGAAPQQPMPAWMNEGAVKPPAHLADPGAAGRPAAAGAQPQVAGQAQPGPAGAGLMTVSITYDGYTGPIPPGERLRTIVMTFPGYVPDTFQADYAAKKVEFQHRGELNQVALQQILAGNGFPTIEVESGSAP